MIANPYESPETVGTPAERKPGGLKSTLLSLLAIGGVLAILIALLLPAVRRPTEAGRRMGCANNLKQIMLALRNYEDVYHCFPPAYTVDASGKPLHSWRTLILPFMEQEVLYEQIDLSKPWDDPINQAAFEARPVSGYRCPSAGLPIGRTTYLAVVAPGGCFQATEPRMLADVTDNPNWTLMVVEVSPEQAVDWMSPNDASEKSILNRAAAGKPSHRNGAQAACVSGHIMFLYAEMQPAALRALISIAGNDDAAAEPAD